MSKFSLTGALIIGLASLLPVAAYASGPIATPVETPPTSVMFLAPNFDYQWQNLPKFQTGSLAGGSTTFFYSKSPTVSGPAGGITAGFFLPNTWPQFGEAARIELQGQVFDLTDNTSRTYPGGSPGATQWTPVKLATTLTTGGVFTNSLHTEYKGYDLGLRAATDIPVFGPLAITPAAGIFGGNSNTTFDYADTQACAAGSCFREYQHESVSTDRLGSTLSLGARYPIMPQLSVIGGVSGSLFGAFSRLAANDCFAGTAGNVPCGAGVLTATSSNKNTIGGRLGGQLGLRYNVGWGAFDLSGGVDWDSSVPGVANPVAGGIAAIRYASELGYHAGLKLTVPFGGGATVTPAAAVAPPPAPPAPAAIVPQKQVFIVFFEFDKSSLTPDGKKIVDAAAAAFNAGKSGVAIAGYTDLSGTQQYNLALSKRRADTVKSALVKDGVPASAIDAKWFGEENPRVPTANGVREPQNRRVEITM